MICKLCNGFFWLGRRVCRIRKPSLSLYRITVGRHHYALAQRIITTITDYTVILTIIYQRPLFPFRFAQRDRQTDERTHKGHTRNCRTLELWCTDSKLSFQNILAIQFRFHGLLSARPNPREREFYDHQRMSKLLLPYNHHHHHDFLSFYRWVELHDSQRIFFWEREWREPNVNKVGVGSLEYRFL